eukprot:TRINITY_DN6332_c1_g1_i1.p1 TRINITY_DN6332_c1_g1~~TRINITY_DN6332_c1_g1_i1.p1  ORF type:complete len:261 (-),score=38.70 TRINITY_DN6332_c1_g1_i1:87-812(-)
MSAELSVNGEELRTVFDGRNVKEEKAWRQLDDINRRLGPNAVHIARLDLRFAPKDMKTIFASPASLDASSVQALLAHYSLPRPALHALSISAKQELSILDDEYVDPRLGPFARAKDGGELETENDELGFFPCLYDVTRQNSHRELLQCQRFHTSASSDGTCVNTFMSIFTGSGTWHHMLPNGEKSRLTLTCDSSTAWRIMYRGDRPCAYRLDLGSRCLAQIIGPSHWEIQRLEEPSPFEDD